MTKLNKQPNNSNVKKKKNYFKHIDYTDWLSELAALRVPI